MKASRFLSLILLALALVGLPTFAADVSTNDILNLAQYANDGFQTGFGVGLPILIVMLLMGWLLYGLRRGLKGRR